jgi:hypothetical protein
MSLYIRTEDPSLPRYAWIPSLANASSHHVGMRMGSDEWQAFRDEWAEALTLFGGYGYRPKLIPDGLIGCLADGSSFIVSGEDGTLGSPHYDAELRIQVRGSDRDVRREQEVAYDGTDELLLAVQALLKRCRSDDPNDGPFIRHFPPKSELARVRLAVCYCAYRPCRGLPRTQPHRQPAAEWHRLATPFRSTTPPGLNDVRSVREGAARIRCHR